MIMEEELVASAREGEGQPKINFTLPNEDAEGDQSEDVPPSKSASQVDPKWQHVRQSHSSPGRSPRRRSKEGRSPKSSKSGRVFKK